MSYKFDHQTDYSGKEMYSMFSGVELPEYVKKAEAEDSFELKGLPKTAFADTDRKIYPINSPENVYLSNAYFINKRADISKVYGEDYACQLETKIAEAADVLGISADLEEYNRQLNIKKASDYDQNYMVDFVVDGMTQAVQMYPVKTAADLTESAASFAANISNFPFDVRVKAAANFVKEALALGVDEMPDILMKYAGLFYPDLPAVQEELWRRSTKLANENNRKIYEAMSNDVPNMTSVREVMKIAETCFNIENMEGLYDKPKVAQVLGDPVDMFFSASLEKVAADLSFVEAHGDKYKLDDLMKISKDKYEEAFGDCGIDPASPEKIADILPTMPRSDIKLFEEISGIRPI